MSKTLHVGNLVWEATCDDLYHLFERYGKVRLAQVIMDRATGRSRGFGFVEMDDDLEARNALTALNGHAYRGRELTVADARPRDERRTDATMDPVSAVQL
jgi:RNA recognition motif-containing protein